MMMKTGFHTHFASVMQVYAYLWAKQGFAQVDPVYTPLQLLDGLLV
jgi:hypothetical protein